MKRMHLALVMLALCLATATATTAAAVAAQPSPPTIEDQNDRLLQRLQAEQAAQEQAALEQYRSYERMERDFTPPSTAHSAAAARPTAPIETAMPGRRMDVLATLLLGLVGGLVGGCGAMAGWTAIAHRRVRRAASAA
jgi:ABC-type transporter MlaC component